MYPDRVVQRVMAKWTRNGDCWISDYSVGSHGYSQVGWVPDGGPRSIMTLVHRVAWSSVNGPVPDDMTVDHICHTKRCVNPDHLRLLTNQDNASDNLAVRINSDTGRKCMYGHPSVVRTSNGSTYCRECKRIRSAAQRSRSRLVSPVH